MRRLEKRKDVNRDLVPSFLASIHARILSLSLTLSLVHVTHTMRKMQRITICFLSPFVHKMSNLILEARFLYLHALNHNFQSDSRADSHFILF